MNLISTQDVAKRLGVSFWTVARWARMGLIPSIRMGRRRLFDPQDIEDWVTQCKKRQDVRFRIDFGKDAQKSPEVP